MENFAPYVQHISSYFSSNAVGVPCKIRGKLLGKALEDKEFPQKKVLSLVLCVAVMLSVMVMGAGAAFSDQDKIENKEAVDMCAALNIIGGYPDGSYKPEGNIKRSEICKMICVALNGGEEPPWAHLPPPHTSPTCATPPTLLGRRSTLSPACPRASCPAWAAAGSAPTAM